MGAVCCPPSVEQPLRDYPDSNGNPKKKHQGSIESAATAEDSSINNSLPKDEYDPKAFLKNPIHRPIGCKSSLNISDLEQDKKFGGGHYDSEKEI